MNNIKLIIIAFSVSLLMYACAPADGEFTGSEYMPDMGHSLALEANTSNYYYYNTWDKESTITLNALLKRSNLPVTGTVPRGYAGQFLDSNAGMEEGSVTDITIPTNGSVPYYYVDTEESRAQAIAEIIENPFPISADGLARGKELYNIFCGICHGEKANGLGYLYDADENPNAKYLAAPANLINEEFTAASNGRFYHAIMYGKNVMGGYSDKISYEERWQVIHYIRSLQAKEAGATYNEDENTFNAAFGIPGASVTPYTPHPVMMEEGVEGHDMEAPHTEGEHDTDQH
ncbi:c-type cytochrome [Lewinella cohaerens]|uniref:c-type cytochrome n=1 Tax=Lewinella cohaerens TaxID=70995 RepID=UPI00036980CE|nr:cytochrome c [Lewinella cohaerens]